MDCTEDLLKIGHPPAHKTKTVQYNLEEGEFLYRKTPKKFRAPGEDQNNKPPSSSSNVTTEQLEAPWRARLKII